VFTKPANEVELRNGLSGESWRSVRVLGARAALLNKRRFVRGSTLPAFEVVVRESFTFNGETRRVQQPNEVVSDFLVRHFEHELA
jgi:hypothetical protein